MAAEKGTTNTKTGGSMKVEKVQQHRAVFVLQFDTRLPYITSITLSKIQVVPCLPLYLARANL